MSSVPRPQVDDTIYAVRIWKDTLDPRCKWWQRWFHRFIYLPFNEFSLKVVKLPPATNVTVEGDKVTFGWLEDGGFFGSEHEADIACLTNRWSYQGLPFGRLLPFESGQCVVAGPTIFPRARNPRKRVEPVLSLVIKDRKQEERDKQECAAKDQQLAEYLTQINQVLSPR